MKEQIRKLRVKIDGVAQLTKESNTNHIGGSKEMDKTVDSLYLAKAWLSKVLGELGEATPYANDGNRKTVDDIEPAADTLHRFKVKSIGFNKNIASTYVYYNLLKENWDMFNYIEKVDWLREEISNIFKTWKSLEITGLNWTTVVSFEQHIQEARFWLGFELERIRESSNSNI